MPNIIKIKRSTTTATPASLAEGELAYSELSSNLFIGTSGGNLVKIGGKSDADKLAGIEANANNYTHPAYTVQNVSSTGVETLTAIVTDATGHVTSVTKAAIRAATTSVSGVVQLSSSTSSTSTTLAATASAVKAAYDLANTGATHAGTAHAPSTAQANADITKAEIEAKLIGTISSHDHAAATTLAAGYMSAADKTKLDGIAASANNYTHPAYTVQNVSSTGVETITAITSDATGHVTGVTKAAMRTASTSQTGVVQLNSTTTSTSTTLAATASAVKAAYDQATIGADHAGTAHAPSTAQANADITKAEIEAKLTGTISTHTHAEATTGAAGLLSAADKTKLNTYGTNAVGNRTISADQPTGGVDGDLWYTTGAGFTLTKAGVEAVLTGDIGSHYHDSRYYTEGEIDSMLAALAVGEHGHDAATPSTDGFMSAADKGKLDGIATGANNYSHPNHTGDVTSTGDGATVIANDAVTNAKLANMAVNTIKGRITAGTGDPEDLTAANVRTIITDSSNRFVTDAEKTTWNAKQDAITGGASTITASNLTASRALVSDGSGKVAVSAVTSTQLGYLSTTTSDVQTQLNAKAPIANPTFTGTVTLAADPTNALHAATKQYVDAVATGLDCKASVRVATTANITLSGTQTIDGISVVAGDRVLVKNQSTASGNGIYVVAAGAWTRATDADVSAEVTSGMFTFVEQGTTQGATGWVLSTTGAITLGTTSLIFTQFSGSGTYLAGNGITLTGNTFSVAAGTGLTQEAGGLRIDANYAGQTTITTLGTIATGTWNATTIAVNKGGTGVTSITGLVKGNGTSAFSAAVAGTDYLSPSSTIDGGTF